MDHFQYRDGQLFAEQVAVANIVSSVATPCYIYSHATIERHWRAFDCALEGHAHLVCYAVKANSNIAILNVLAALGSGFDIVSGGELARVLLAGGKPEKIVFSGVGKTEGEICQALEAGILCFNVESSAELERINWIASSMGCVAPVALRVNPDVDPKTHPHIATGLRTSKFGIDIHAAADVFRQAVAMAHIRIIGVACHIGSQLTDVAPYVAATDRLRQLVELLDSEGIAVQHIDIGGGLGICYHNEIPPSPMEFASAVVRRLGSDKKILIEPGRAIVGNAGILITRVEYLKHTGERNFAIVDAGMNDLMRPALYEAWQEIVPVRPRTGTVAITYDVVGPVCETADYLGKQRELALAAGDLLAVRSAGAYGFTMSSNYNSRLRPPEVLVDGNRFSLIRERETMAQLWCGERIPGAEC